MNKEEAKKLIIREVKSEINVRLFSDVTFLDTAKALKKILSYVDQIEPDHQKVKLPREVGEDLEDWLATDNVDNIISYLTCGYDDDHEAVHQWWNSRLNATYLIADMDRYGWEAEEKPKRYVLPMPGTEYHNIQMHGNAQYYAIKGTGNWRPDAIALGTDDAVKHGYTVTQADIDAAPAWVKGITPIEVTDDDD